MRKGGKESAERGRAFVSVFCKAGVTEPLSPRCILPPGKVALGSYLRTFERALPSPGGRERGRGGGSKQLNLRGK